MARRVGSSVGMEVNSMELLRFIANDFNPMNVVCKRAIYDRPKAVFE